MQTKHVMIRTILANDNIVNDRDDYKLVLPLNVVIKANEYGGIIVIIIIHSICLSIYMGLFPVNMENCENNI